MTLPNLRHIGLSIPLAIVAGLAGVWVAKPPAVRSVTIPPETSMSVRLDQTLASNQSRPGDQFDATLSGPVWVNGAVAIPEGARIKGKVVDARPSDSLEGTARLRVTLSYIKMNGKLYELHTTDVVQYGRGYKKRDREFAAGGAGGGALRGALADRGKGDLIGSPVGTGAGVVGAATTGKKNVRMPVETPLNFRLIEPLVVAVKD